MRRRRRRPPASSLEVCVAMACGDDRIRCMLMRHMQRGLSHLCKNQRPHRVALTHLGLALWRVPCVVSFVASPALGWPARHRPERQHNARSNRRKQCSPNETKPCSNPTPPRKRQNTPTNGHTPRRMNPTHTRLTYTSMRPHAPSHQAGDHPVPAHTERHNPPKVQTQRQ